METYGLKEWSLGGYLSFFDSNLKPIPWVRDGSAGLYSIPFNLTVVVEEKGYRVVDKSKDLDVILAKFEGIGVYWFNFKSGSYDRIGFSPFLNIWPNRPKPILMYLALREPEIEYLGFRLPSLEYSWVYSSTYIYEAGGSQRLVKEVGVSAIRTNYWWINISVDVDGKTIVLSDTFSWITASYKGSLLLEGLITVPVDYVNPEFLRLLDVSSSDLSRVAYVTFIVLPSQDSLRVMGTDDSGILYTIYPFLGALISGLGVLAARWVFGKLLKQA